MQVIIDRFEGEYAVCETEERRIINIHKSHLPPEAREGDVLSITDEHITIDIEKTKERKERIEKLIRDLWE
ncbi:hypothetical protein Cst_c12570 [Thermoclostridium stercorarium subsp. stercorarium DSM 8532]|jgi:hypothetical protein|uniref:Uncharacterized protein n=3 Tax=Thermoclostridium stercorarium TaxID=1510 RepID=L7VNK8_THES1|nr:DUF3006 domain-containing protein [Thermoclostridium stercorarium]AGC68249.1 hypothetical protein Cst_c12570 [Thermoclostridium stercorarium subsp. stercorarium DSM 8532]AGI39276.1 hypothetical protein Clst_1214 [Thermoclostridium stercorarium subsp. stercorarium DSM 8532]ANW98610.1 pyruvate kinase [Thermoclostridium stercorarium subsp. thermolacticum DSM 2910]ANX01151.1 pyruvate kinase [Thermoclostridium stercorarium subsp. leptospartum DSM 9219]UZQ86765.1 DUF3006 domain-containing protein